MKPPSRQSLGKEVLDYLREAIIRGYLDPGERLQEPALAEALGVSRGPVREALAELDREGLVKVRHRRGATVTRLSDKDVEEIYVLRVALERLAMERAAELATEEDFASMDTTIEAFTNAVERNATEEAVDLDIQFHDLVFQAAHHSRLHSCWMSLRSQTRAFLLSSIKGDTEYLAIVAPEHALLKAVLAERDGVRAVRLIEDHMQGAYNRLAQISSTVKNDR